MVQVSLGMASGDHTTGHMTSHVTHNYFRISTFWFHRGITAQHDVMSFYQNLHNFTHHIFKALYNYFDIYFQPLFQLLFLISNFNLQQFNGTFLVSYFLRWYTYTIKFNVYCSHKTKYWLFTFSAWDFNCNPNKILANIFLV